MWCLVGGGCGGGAWWEDEVGVGFGGAGVGLYVHRQAVLKLLLMDMKAFI